MDITTHLINMNSYIDCHSHILYGIDDGANDIEASIKILKQLESLGFKEVVLTPHYRGTFLANNSLKEKLFDELTKKVKEENINIKLYLANEVKITSNILELKEKEEIKLLGNYLFLELPFDIKIHNLDKIIYNLQSNNINVILVHPERYNYLSYNDYKKLIDSDVLFQVNYESIIGKFGLRAKIMIKYLYKNDMVDFIATDVHHATSSLFPKFSTIEKKIIKLIGEYKYRDLVYNNIKKVLDEIK